VSINLTDAAKYYQELPHQVEAWNWLQQTLSPEDLSVFADKYREAPKEEFDNTWDGVYAAAKKQVPNSRSALLLNGLSRVPGESTQLVLIITSASKQPKATVVTYKPKRFTTVKK
jgi:hypothetical protein